MKWSAGEWTCMFGDDMLLFLPPSGPERTYYPNLKLHETPAHCVFMGHLWAVLRTHWHQDCWHQTAIRLCIKTRSQIFGWNNSVVSACSGLTEHTSPAFTWRTLRTNRTRQCCPEADTLLGTFSNSCTSARLLSLLQHSVNNTVWIVNRLLAPTLLS